MQEFVEKEWVEMPYIDIETTTMIKFWDTITNLETAIAGEYEERADMYPEFAKVAEEEWFPQFAAKIKCIMVAEKHHEERYKKLLDLVRADKFFQRDEEIYWTCTKCGYVWKWKEPPKVCPLCGHERDYYEGNFKNGYFEGFGKYFHANGDYYEGNWENDNRSGEGRLARPGCRGEISRGDEIRGCYRADGTVCVLWAGEKSLCNCSYGRNGEIRKCNPS